MLSIICVDKHPRLFYSFNHTECHSQELNKAKSIKEPSVDSPEIKENNKHTEHVQSLIEQVMLCYIHYSEDHLLTIVHSLSNILHLI